MADGLQDKRLIDIMFHFYEKKLDAVLLHIKVTPKASANKILGVLRDGFMSSLKIAIVAVPENGKANKELTKFLSKTLAVNNSAVSIMKGETNQIKLVQVRGNPDELEKLLLAHLTI